MYIKILIICQIFVNVCTYLNKFSDLFIYLSIYLFIYLYLFIIYLSSYSVITF